MKKDELLELQKCLKKLFEYSQKDECSRHNWDKAFALVNKQLKTK